MLVFARTRLVLADVDGVVIDAAVSQPEPTVIHLVPVEPLDNVVYGVLWTMKAGDAHPKSGTITFQVDAPLPSPVEQAAHFPQLLVIATPGPFFFLGEVPEEMKQATEQMQLGGEFATHSAGFDR